MSVTIAIVIITIIISVFAFREKKYTDMFLLNPYLTYHKKEYWRLLTHGFIHANWWHLGINMFVLYSFGMFCERYIIRLAQYQWIRFPLLHYIILYFGGIIIASLPSLFRHKNHPWYNAVGASGGVAAVVFATIFFQPLQKIYFYFIPVPGIVFGIIYIAYSHYMAKKGTGNINHDAHFAGAVFGFLYPLLMQPHLFSFFIQQLTL